MNLPKKLEGKARCSLINVQNVDSNCFSYSVCAAIHGKSINFERRTLPDSYNQFLNRYDFTAVGGPTMLNSHNFQKFEAANNISLCVFGYDNDEKNPHVFPLFISTNEFKKQVDLLYISNGVNSHYVAIQSLSGLLRDQSKDNARLVCRRCLHQFTSEKDLNNHQSNCNTHKPQRMLFAEPSEKIKFKNNYRQQRVGNIVYADLESVLKPCNNPETDFLQTHKICSAAALMISDDPDIPNRRFLEREDVSEDDVLMSNFINFLSECASIAYQSSTKVLKMSSEDEQNFETANKCWICEQLYSERDIRTRDHDHISKFVFKLIRCNLAL